MKPLIFSSTDLRLLQRQLDSWRQRQNGRGRLPQELWDVAAKLALTQGVSAVARSLRIDFYRLQRRTGELSAPDEAKPMMERFVELKLNVPPQPVSATSGWVELMDGPDRRMRLHTGHDPAAWVALARSFWRTGQ
jgi:hypothetical protein